MNAAELLLMVLKMWGTVGVLIAALFLSFGIDRIDEDAREAYFFRPLLIPGVLVIWPLVLWRWYRYETGSDRWQSRYDPPLKSHFWVGLILPIGIALIVVTGLSQRQSWPLRIAPVQISEPSEVSQ